MVAQAMCPSCGRAVPPTARYYAALRGAAQSRRVTRGPPEKLTRAAPCRGRRRRGRCLVVRGSRVRLNLVLAECDALRWNRTHLDDATSCKRREDRRRDAARRGNGSILESDSAYMAEFAPYLQPDGSYRVTTTTDDVWECRQPSGRYAMVVRDAETGRIRQNPRYRRFLHRRRLRC